MQMIITVESRTPSNLSQVKFLVANFVCENAWSNPISVVKISRKNSNYKKTYVYSVQAPASIQA